MAKGFFGNEMKFPRLRDDDNMRLIEEGFNITSMENC